jgi:paraquat-inducible protein B
VSRRANPALIGGFVLGAMALGAAAVVALASGRLFRSTQTFVLFFHGSVNGLEKGSPVKFRGVPIGSVTDILLALPQKRGDPRIPVLIDVEQDRLVELGTTFELNPGPGMITELSRNTGLRAQLQQQSFVTGLLYIGLDLFPDSPFDLVLPVGGPYPEIPTLPTKLEQAQAKIEAIVDRLSQIDWESVGRSLTSAVDGLSRLVNSPELQSNLVALRQTLAEIRNAIGPLGASATGATNDLRAAIKRLQATLERLDALSDPKAPLVQGLNGALGEVAEAARAVKRLAEDLDRDPSMLIRGKPR